MLPTTEYCAKRRILSVFLKGELDHHTARPARELCDMALNKYRPALLVLDFSSVTFMDSSGIGLVMGRYKRMQELRADVLIANPPPQVEKLMRIASIDKLVRIVYTAHTASVKE
ncbi:MAG: anti-sigma factor antagonist [Ruminococcus sp.]|nr:anti-sigma factor antagonist [Ruminococcus sp.]